MSSETITRNDLTNILNEVVAIDGTDMTAQEIQDFVDSLNVTGIHAVDYIVEQGTDGIWTYRKWNSGVYELWGYTTNSCAMTNALGETYYGTVNVSISGLGIVVINGVQVTGRASGHYFGTKVDNIANDILYLSCRASASNTTNVTHYIQITGTWK